MRPLFLLLALMGTGKPDTVTSHPQNIDWELQRRALRYFVENINPLTGLIRDRARNFTDTPDIDRYRMASIASTGFGLAVLSHAATNGLLPRDQVYPLVERALISATKMEKHNGWLYHFVDWNTGARFGNSEVSTVDTSWFIAGALYVRSVFPGTLAAKLADDLYEGLDFEDMRTDGGSDPKKELLSLGWTPESKYIPFDWDKYAEHMFLYLLGLGKLKNPLGSESWAAWQRVPLELIDGVTMLGPRMPLFVHQYSHLFLDLRNRQDSLTDYFANSVNVSTWARQFCLSMTNVATYKEGFWGLSAGDSPSTYAAFSPADQNGTVCVGCAVASTIFDPTVLKDAETWWESPLNLVGRYGFPDSINLTVNWIDPDVIGITVGSIYLSLANMHDGNSPWKVFSAIPEITTGMERAGFKK
jgi:hypothetical protein